MRRYIIRRLLVAIPVLFMVTLLASGLTRLAPGDAVTRIVAESQGSFTPEQLANIKRDLGLDRPFLIKVDGDFPWFHPGAGSQYGSWVKGVFTGDLGESLGTGHFRIGAIIKDAIPVSLQLMIMALIISLLVALPVGIYSAIRQDSVGDYAGRIFAVAGLSVPDFIIGTMVLLVGALSFNWTPPLDYKSFFDDPLSNLTMMITPALIVGVRLSSITARMLRSSMLEVMRQDYVRTAWAKGLRERTVIIRHAMKNAFIPVVTVIGTQMGFLIGGVAIIETIFNLPGLGRVTVNAIDHRDLPLIQTNVFFFASALILINLLVDISYAWFDPRIRYG
jgi:peptide/nickel transport system permease protein